MVIPCQYAHTRIHITCIGHNLGIGTRRSSKSQIGWGCGHRESGCLAHWRVPGRTPLFSVWYKGRGHTRNNIGPKPLQQRKIYYDVDRSSLGQLQYRHHRMGEANSPNGSWWLEKTGSGPDRPILCLCKYASKIRLCTHSNIYATRSCNKPLSFLVPSTNPSS